MPEKPQNFWQELKRRKVIRVIIGYAAAAYVLLELTSIIAEPLGLPDWTINFVLILLCIGFVITVVVSWIYDFTPKGIEKTKPAKVAREKETITKPPKRKLKVSDIIISVLLIAVIVLVYPKIFKKDKLEQLRSEEKITIAVMPFQNMTNDTLWNVWQNGIQDILVTYLSNSPKELKVRQTESVKDLIQSKGLTNYASLTPSVASNISQKLDANIFIYGSIKKAGSRIRINAQLIDSKTQETFKSFEIDGPSEQSTIFQVTDSLKKMVGNYLIISMLKAEFPIGFKYYESTNSPEAFRYYIYGRNAFSKKNFSLAAELFSQAVAIDTNFTSAILLLAFSYFDQYMVEEAKQWYQKLHEKRDQMPYELKLRTNWLYAALYETPYEELDIVRQLQEIDDQSPLNYFSLGFLYVQLEQYDKAIPEFETSLKIYEKRGLKPKWAYNYIFLGYAYHMTGQYNKEKKLYKKAEEDFPGDIDLLINRSILSFTEEDTISANKYIGEVISILKGQSSSEITIASYLSSIYTEAGILDKAEEYNRQALSLDPESPARMNNLAYFLINNDRNINEGLELIDKALKESPDNPNFLDTKGWGLYKQDKYQEAYDILQKSWDLRMENAIYSHQALLHLEAAKKAVADQNN